MTIENKEVQIDAYGIQLTKEDIKLIEKILDTIKKNYTGTISSNIIDIGIEEYSATPRALIFGRFVEEQMAEKIEDSRVWVFPDVKKLHKKPENKEQRDIATTRIQSVIEDLAYEIIEEEVVEEEKEETELYVEKNGTTFGKIADICITEKEAEYLRKIKDLLAGSKIVIKKGDITIEVE